LKRIGDLLVNSGHWQYFRLLEPKRELTRQITHSRSPLDVAPFEIRRAEDIAPAFEALKGRAEALYVVGDLFALLGIVCFLASVVHLAAAFHAVWLLDRIWFFPFRLAQGAGT
jgi:hypothetical protein